MAEPIQYRRVSKNIDARALIVLKTIAIKNNLTESLALSEILLHTSLDIDLTNKEQIANEKTSKKRNPKI